MSPYRLLEERCLQTFKYFKQICIFNIYAKIKKRAAAVALPCIAAVKLKSNNETLIPWGGWAKGKKIATESKGKTAQRKKMLWKLRSRCKNKSLRSAAFVQRKINSNQMEI